MVADHQGGRHQGRMTLTNSMDSLFGPKHNLVLWGNFSVLGSTRHVSRTIHSTVSAAATHIGRAENGTFPPTIFASDRGSRRAAGYLALRLGANGAAVEDRQPSH